MSPSMWKLRNVDDVFECDFLAHISVVCRFLAESIPGGSTISAKS